MPHSPLLPPSVDDGPRIFCFSFPSVSPCVLCPPSLWTPPLLLSLTHSCTVCLSVWLPPRESIAFSDPRGFYTLSCIRKNLTNLLTFFPFTPAASQPDRQFNRDGYTCLRSPFSTNSGIARITITVHVIIRSLCVLYKSVFNLGSRIAGSTETDLSCNDMTVVHIHYVVEILCDHDSATKTGCRMRARVCQRFPAPTQSMSHDRHLFALPIIA